MGTEQGRKKILNRNQENSNAINTHGEPSEEENNNPSGNTTGRDPSKDKHSKGHIVIPYTQGLVGGIKEICSKYGIQTHFKGNRTIKEMVGKTQRQGSYRQKEWGLLLLSVWRACMQ